MKHVFIINPISGKGHALEFIWEIENYFKINGGDYEIIKTERISHATEIAKEYCKKYQEVTIYSVGGDGTMKEILDGIQENAIMCVIPGGTGNDFYKSIYKVLAAGKADFQCDALYRHIGSIEQLFRPIYAAGQYIVIGCHAGFQPEPAAEIAGTEPSHTRQHIHGQRLGQMRVYVRYHALNRPSAFAAASKPGIVLHQHTQYRVYFKRQFAFTRPRVAPEHLQHLFKRSAHRG